jgi:hypothetical protein
MLTRQDGRTIRVEQPPHEMPSGLYRHLPADAPRRVPGLGVMIFDISLPFGIKSKIMTEDLVRSGR